MMMAGAAGEVEGASGSESVLCVPALFGCISFGNFVFLGLRSNSGIKHQGQGDLYLNGEDGL
jgi:hypothetical protein